MACISIAWIQLKEDEAMFRETVTFFLKDEILLYENLGDQLRDHHPELMPAVEDAIAAVKVYGVCNGHDILMDTVR